MLISRNGSETHRLVWLGYAVGSNLSTCGLDLTNTVYTFLLHSCMLLFFYKPNILVLDQATGEDVRPLNLCVRFVYNLFSVYPCVIFLVKIPAS